MALFHDMVLKEVNSMKKIFKNILNFFISKKNFFVENWFKLSMLLVLVLMVAVLFNISFQLSEIASNIYHIDTGSISNSIDRLRY